MYPGDPLVEPDALASAVTGWIDELATLDDDASDRQRIERIRQLERMKAASAAAQAVETAAFAASARSG